MHGPIGKAADALAHPNACLSADGPPRRSMDRSALCALAAILVSVGVYRGS